MGNFIIVPGIGGSGERHWQTIWERADPAMRRFAPSSWESPDLDDWIEALDRAVASTPEPPVLVAHSLACLLVAHWQQASARAAAGALLVSVPDPSGPAFPREALEFGGFPEGPLRFPSLVVASSDDPYGSLAYAKARAAGWASEFVEVGPHGHINAASNLGDWAAGRTILDRFVARLARPIP